MKTRHYILIFVNLNIKLKTETYTLAAYKSMDTCLVHISHASRQLSSLLLAIDTIRFFVSISFSSVPAKKNSYVHVCHPSEKERKSICKLKLIVLVNETNEQR